MSHTGEIALAGSRRMRSMLAAAPVLFAHAVVTVAKNASSFCTSSSCGEVDNLPARPHLPAVSLLIRGCWHHAFQRESFYFYIVCRCWIFDGQLLDDTREFFVAVDASVPDERLWLEKYSLNHAMVPAFIGESNTT